MSGTRSRRPIALLLVAVVFTALVVVVAATSEAGAALAPAAPKDGPSPFPGSHLVTRIASGRCLDAEAQSLNKPRTNVQLWDCRWAGDPDESHQLFDQLSIPGRPAHEFRLLNQKSGKCLTYHPGGWPKPVWAERCDREGQGWRIENVPGGQQFVAMQTSGLCLNVVETTGPLRAGIDLYQCAQQPYNTWTLF